MSTYRAEVGCLTTAGDELFVDLGAGMTLASPPRFGGFGLGFSLSFDSKFTLTNRIIHV